MKIVIAGASGFIGTAMTRAFLDAGHQVTGLGRSSGHPCQAHAAFVWQRADTTHPGAWQAAVADADAVVNLAGASIFHRWTRIHRRRMVASRCDTTANIAAAMVDGGGILLSTSAVGYYGSRGDAVLTEASSPGSDFLARLAIDWERAALDAETKGNRVAIMRFGVVLGAGGGALAQMLPAYRRFAGGPLGSGHQWFAWIHLADLLDAVRFLLDRQDARGVYNFCAPETVRQKAFAHALGAALGRPALIPVPRPVLRLILGEAADVLTASQRVQPARLIADGFRFRFGSLERALADLVTSP